MSYLKAQPYYFTGQTEENEEQVHPGRVLINTSLCAALFEKILVGFRQALKDILERVKAYT